MIGMLCVLGLLFIHEGMMRDANDMHIYRTIGQNALAEEPKFESEYPPFISAMFALMSMGDQENFTRLWIALLCIWALSIAVYGTWVLHDSIATGFPLLLAFSVLLLGPTIAFARFDILVLLALFLAWRTYEKGRMSASGAWLALAVAIKLVPILLLPLFVLMAPPRGRKALLLGFAAAGVACTAFALAVLGPMGLYANLIYMLPYHAERGLQAESLWAGLYIQFQKITDGPVGIGFHHGAYHVADIPGWLSQVAAALTLGGTALITWLGWRRRTDRTAFRRHIFAVILWSVATSMVLSPQYLVWIIPLLILSFWEQRAVAGVSWMVVGIGAVLVALLTQWLYPGHYDQLIGMDPFALSLLNIRNVLLPVLAVILLLPKHAMSIRLRDIMQNIKSS